MGILKKIKKNAKELADKIDSVAEFRKKWNRLRKDKFRRVFVYREDEWKEVGRLAEVKQYEVFKMKDRKTGELFRIGEDTEFVMMQGVPETLSPAMPVKCTGKSLFEQEIILESWDKDIGWKRHRSFATLHKGDLIRYKIGLDESVPWDVREGKSIYYVATEPFFDDGKPQVMMRVAEEPDLKRSKLNVALS